jgi:hypothetical protein
MYFSGSEATGTQYHPDRNRLQRLIPAIGTHGMQSRAGNCP